MFGLLIILKCRTHSSQRCAWVRQTHKAKKLNMAINSIPSRSPSAFLLLSFIYSLKKYKKTTSDSFPQNPISHFHTQITICIFLFLECLYITQTHLVIPYNCPAVPSPSKWFLWTKAPRRIGLSFESLALSLNKSSWALALQHWLLNKHTPAHIRSMPGAN